MLDVCLVFVEMRLDHALDVIDLPGITPEAGLVVVLSGNGLIHAWLQVCLL